MSALLTNSARLITRHPAIVLMLLAFATVLAGVYAATQFRVNADQTSLVAPDSAFQIRFGAFRDAFPAYRRTSLIVVEAASRPAAIAAAQDLSAALEQRTDVFQSVFAASALPFFQKNGILYLKTDEVADQLDAIAQAQPGIALVLRQKGLAGLLDLIEQGAADAATNSADGTATLPAQLQALAESLTQAARRTAQTGAPPPRIDLPGTTTEPGETAIELISVRIREDQTDMMSPSSKLQVIRDTATDLGLTEDNGITIRLTGNVPLSVDELKQVRQSLGLAGTLSFIMLALVLGLGVRSTRIVAVMFLTLIVGGVWSMAWAMFSIGEVNILSASFAVLFVGLGIDFAIHYALRAQEDVEAGMATPKALAEAAGDVGPAIAMGAVTSAIGFLSFMPTDYKGFADLGVIAGGGMILACLAALTVLPATLSLIGVPDQRSAGARFNRTIGRLFGVSRIVPGRIAMAAGLIGLVSIGLATQARFDFSTLSLKNSNSEPIQALADLQNRGLVTDYAAYVVTPSLEDAEQAAARMADLPVIKRVQTASSLIPQDQDEKLAAIEETGFLFFALRGMLDRPAAELSDTLAVPLPDGLDPASREALATLNEALAALSQPQRAALNGALANQLTRDISLLMAVFDAEPVTDLDQVPQGMRDRFIAEDGQALAIGLPEGDVTRTPDLRRFVAQVKEAFPDSTGRAVVEATVGDVVVEAFITALLLALAAVSVIVLIATRSILDTALVLTPLLLAAMATAATGVAIGMPFNQANIIVLPLIMGLGVDNGIHVLMRYRRDGSLDGMLKSSTPRAIVLSTLTTIGAFGALSASVHAGTASMGVLLTIAMLYLLVVTVFVLPALLSLRGKLRHQ